MPTTISFVLQPGRVATLVHEENVSSIYVLQPNILLNAFPAKFDVASPVLPCWY